IACSSLGQYERAQEAFRSALATCERIGLSTMQTLAGLGIALAKGGKIAEGRALLERALDESRQHQGRRISGYLLVMLAELHIEANEFESAAENAGEALDSGSPPLEAFALATLTRARVALGRIDEALESARAAVALAESGVNIDEYTPLVHSAHAEALNASGQHRAARVAIRIARDGLLETAHRMDDPTLRESFLSRVPENIRILAIARAWLG
ncbi:MAG TPA: serine/threonine-protein kinase PknK, partial [Polyangiaceae bacterium]|nr:serine/threonine-protein kinase PknK [Polyangiaceae bacterium]